MGRGSPMYRVLDSGSEGPGFDIRSQIKTHRVHWDRRARKICGVQSPEGAYDVASQMSTSSPWF